MNPYESPECRKPARGLLWVLGDLFVVGVVFACWFAGGIVGVVMTLVLWEKSEGDAGALPLWAALYGVAIYGGVHLTRLALLSPDACQPEE
jgi:hypothetical protein